MKRLELDFVRSPAPPAWAGWALFALAIAFAADLALSYQALREEVAVKRAQAARLAGQALGADLVRVSQQPPSPEEAAFARDTVKRLATPWQELFRALEAARTDSITLHSVEPDAESGAVSIAGEAKSYLAALGYVATLSSQKAFSRVHLARHDTRDDARGPIAFTVSASWSRRR
jgi:hypothetical protein